MAKKLTTEQKTLGVQTVFATCFITYLVRTRKTMALLKAFFKPRTYNVGMCKIWKNIKNQYVDAHNLGNIAFVQPKDNTNGKRDFF